MYILLYVLMFIAAWRLKGKFARLPRHFVIPGGRIGYYLTCTLGLIGCTLTLVVGFIPPETSMDMGGANHFRAIFASGILAMIFPAFLLYLRKRRQDLKQN
jgi:hypothetical protein